MDSTRRSSSIRRDRCERGSPLIVITCVISSKRGPWGSSIYAGFLAVCGFRILRSFRFAREPDVKALLYVLMGVFAAWLVGSLSGNVMNMTSSQFCFWSALGIALRLAEEDRSTLSDVERRRSGLMFIYPLDPGGTKIGGIETFIRGLATSVPPPGT